MILSPILCRQRCHQHRSSQVSSQTMMEKHFTLKRFELSGLILMIYIVIKIFNLNIVILTSEHTDSSLVCSVLFIPDTQLNVLSGPSKKRKIPIEFLCTCYNDFWK